MSKQHLFRPSIVVGLTYIALLLIFIRVKGYQIIDFIHLGTVWGKGDPNGTWGYDGQFFYQIAVNPLGAAQFMDNAPFRYQRTLYPLFARLISGRNLDLIPYALLFVNWLAIVLGVEILARLLEMHQVSPWFSLGYGLYFGQATAFTFDTTEPFTYFWVCLGIWLFGRQQKTLAALVLGIAAFSRETAVLFPIGYIVFFLIKHQWRDVCRFTLLGVLPLMVWLVILARIFGKTGVTFTPPFETIPFYGIFFHLDTPRKFWLLVLLILIPTTISGILAVKLLWQQKLDPLLFAWLANIAMITFLSHYSYMELISSSRVATGVVLGLIAYGAISKRKPLLIVAQMYACTFPIYLMGVLLGIDSLIV